MSKLLATYERFPYALPILSALALVLTLPPFNFWPIILAALVPLYLFIYREKDMYRIFTGVLFFGLIFSGYLSYITLFSFTWIPEAHLFSSLVKISAIPFVIFISIATALAICLLKTEKEGLTPLERVILFGIFAAIEWAVGKVFIGFNYGSLAYAATHIPALRFMASIGGTLLVTFMVVFGNAAFAEALRFLFQKKNRNRSFLIPLGVFSTIVGLSVAYQYVSTTATTSSISIAIIQDTTRTENEAFGKVVNGSFQFPLLEKRVKEASAQHPDIIIYPFSPWIGALGDTLDNSRFTKDVIGMDVAVFSAWLAAHVPPETTLVTWDTHFTDGTYWNEINYWRNGALVGSYRKIKLFPFMDYTPQWAQRFGIYSLPYDGTAGTSTSPFGVGKVMIGSLVCSEVSRPDSAQENGKTADVLFAIGSEAMFTNSFPNEFNLLNAQLRATESGRMVIRANKFGPSAVIDTYGNIISELPYNQSGILFAKIPAQTERRVTLYSVVTEYPFLILLVGYAPFLWLLWLRKSKKFPWVG
ncbi:MAG: hypothetical protein NT108_02685 [Candidatus Kaiserbacteria bacterium]|nr:hypothetical protein [Candidatus Kaiserbacteria bacterium]